MQQLEGFKAENVKGNVLEWGHCPRCSDTQVQTVTHRMSKHLFDGDYPAPRCRNKGCERQHLPLLRHTVVQMNLEILKVTDEVDLSRLNHCKCCSEEE